MIRWIAVALVALAGCSVIKAPERTAWTTFALESPHPAAADSAAAVTETGGPVIRVAPFASAAGADSPRMVYVRTAGTLEMYAHHRWADPPAEMLAIALVAALEKTGAFGGVLGPSSRAAGDLLLEAELLAFRMDFVETEPRFHATLRATVSDTRTGRPVVAPRTFDVVDPMEEAAPAAGADAARRASWKLVDEVAAYAARAAE